MASHYPLVYHHQIVMFSIKMVVFWVLHVPVYHIRHLSICLKKTMIDGEQRTC